MPRQRSSRRSADDSAPVSLLESIRRATQQPKRRSSKPYSKGEDAGSSRPSKSAAPILPTRMPELERGSPSAQPKSYVQVAETLRKCPTNPPRQIYQPQPMYPCERTVASDQEWAMTPQFSMSPATSVDSQPLLDSPASRTFPWAPFIASPGPHLLQQESRVGYIPPYYWNLLNYHYGQPNERMGESGVASSITGGEMAENHIYFNEPPLSPLDELGVKPYGTADELDAFADLLTWDMVGGGKPLEF